MEKVNTTTGLEPEFPEYPEYTVDDSSAKLQKKLSEKIWLEFIGSDAESIEKAIKICCQFPKQKRDIHFITADILFDLDLEAECIISGLLFGLSNFDEIKKDFGAAVAGLAKNENKITSLFSTGKTIAEAEHIRKMIFALAGDIREIFTVTASKLAMLRYIDTERGIYALSAAEQKKEAENALNIYAPLADRLGLIAIKDEIEDSALKILNNEAYLQVKSLVALKKDERDTFLAAITKIIKDGAAKENIIVDVHARAKHFYSVYLKMRKRGKEAGEVYDLLAVRIICETENECYSLLTMVHKYWKPVAGRFKDYIEHPKPNGYQSLHTTVLASPDTAGNDNENMNDNANMKPLEIQIRTSLMHNTAEYGYASHWFYKKKIRKDGINKDDNRKKLAVDVPNDKDVQDIKTVNAMSGSLAKAVQGNLQEDKLFFDELKKNILADKIYVFTPQYKVIELPPGGTAIDFAYAIHTAIGEHCAMAKADGKIIQLSAELKNTQVIDILTSISARPHINWLSWVKTSKARSKIRNYCIQGESNSENSNKESGPKHRESLAQGHLQSRTENAKPNKIQEQSSEADTFKIRYQGENNMLIRSAKCCNPQYGDDIIGYISRGRGIMIHRRDCKTIVHASDFEERCVAVVWDTSGIKK